MSEAPTRDRTQPLVIPRQRRKQSQTCALCGRPSGAYRYGAHAYCSDKCAREARRIEGAQNKKRRQVAPVLADLTGIALPTPNRQTCYRCNVEKPKSEFNSDKSRFRQLCNVCRDCEKQKFREWYASNKEVVKARTKQRNREVRASETPVLPKGIDPEQNARWFQRAVQNLEEIVQSIPESGPVLLKALDEGRVNGAVFEDQTGCGCLWGTIGRACGWSVSRESVEAKKWRGRGCAEVEIFAHIGPGDLPESNPYARVAKETILRTMVISTSRDRFADMGFDSQEIETLVEPIESFLEGTK